MWERISEAWCRTMHDHAMWPIHGKYVCNECLREYPVPWESAALPAHGDHALTAAAGVTNITRLVA